MNLRLNEGKMPFVLAMTGKCDAGKTSLTKGFITQDEKEMT